MRATNSGKLNPIPDCTIKIPGVLSTQTVVLRSLPDITDSKQAVYNTENIIGRSFPLYTYGYSSDRTISMSLHFFIVNENDGEANIEYLRLIQSAVYPRVGDQGEPFRPPPVCQIQCGKLLGEDPLCCVLQSYNVKFPTNVVWDMKTYCPYQFSVETTWLVVYTSDNLPYSNRILVYGM